MQEENSRLKEENEQLSFDNQRIPRKYAEAFDELKQANHHMQRRIDELETTLRGEDPTTRLL